MTKRLINRIDKLFLTEINKQPTWGKSQITSLFKEAVTKALLEYVDELETPSETKLAKLPYNPTSDIAKAEQLGEYIHKAILNEPVKISPSELRNLGEVFNPAKGAIDDETFPNKLDEEPPFNEGDTVWLD